MTWNETQKAKALPRMLATCRTAIEARGVDDDLFDLLTGMITGGLENAGELVDVAAEMKRIWKSNYLVSAPMRSRAMLCKWLMVVQAYLEGPEVFEKQGWSLTQLFAESRLMCPIIRSADQ